MQLYIHRLTDYVWQHHEIITRIAAISDQNSTSIGAHNFDRDCRRCSRAFLAHPVPQERRLSSIFQVRLGRMLWREQGSRQHSAPPVGAAAIKRVGSDTRGRPSGQQTVRQHQETRSGLVMHHSQTALRQHCVVEQWRFQVVAWQHVGLAP